MSQAASKIPSVIYYDANGDPKAFGAEALVDGIFERAEEEGWYKTEWCVPSSFIYFEPN